MHALTRQRGREEGGQRGRGAERQRGREAERQRGREAERQRGRAAARQRGDRSKRGGLCKDRVCTTELNRRYSYIIKVNAITRATLPVTAGIDVEGKPCITSPESTIPGKASTPNTCSSIEKDRVFAVEFNFVFSFAGLKFKGRTKKEEDERKKRKGGSNGSVFEGNAKQAYGKGVHASQALAMRHVLGRLHTSLTPTIATISP